MCNWNVNFFDNYLSVMTFSMISQHCKKNVRAWFEKNFNL